VVHLGALVLQQELALLERGPDKTLKKELTEFSFNFVFRKKQERFGN
jgi:hypothetical protein